MSIPEDPNSNNINTEHLKDFLSVAASYGINIDTPIIADGKIHRKPEHGRKPGNLNIWYCFFNGSMPFAVFGSWRTGDVVKWYGGDYNNLTIKERKVLHQVIADEAIKAQVLEEEKQLCASWEAKRIWSKSAPADNSHPYLARKGVPSYGLRQKHGKLVIPFYSNGQLTTLQFISSDETKRWLSGGRKKTAFYQIGIAGNTVCIAEGYATGASVYYSKGYATFIAGDAGNLRWVAIAVRNLLPYAKIIICADNDDATPGNPGVKMAKDAARLINGFVAIAGE